MGGVMREVVRIELPLDAEVARALEHPARREAPGRFLSGILRAEGVREAPAKAVAGVKQEACADDSTDEEIDVELEAWRAERSG